MVVMLPSCCRHHSTQAVVMSEWGRGQRIWCRRVAVVPLSSWNGCTERRHHGDITRAAVPSAYGRSREGKCDAMISRIYGKLFSGRTETGVYRDAIGIVSLAGSAERHEPGRVVA